MNGQPDLAGIVVVAVEHAVAAPYCTNRLADAGARVIKIERSEGDFARRYDTDVRGQSAYFVWLNRGKESVCLDFKNADDLALLHALIAGADVFVQNLAPGAAARAGFGSSALRAANPRLITCDISGYGEDGPYAQMKAYDLLVQAESGLAFVTGTPEASARVGVSVCDIAAGMSAHAAILQALYARERTGRGCGLEVSLFDAMADWMNVPYLQYRYGNRAPQRVGLNHPTIAPYGAYTCAGGDAILVAIQNEREWAAFCTGVIERPDLATDERFASNPLRVVNRAALDEIIDACFSAMRIDPLVRVLRVAGVAFGRINDLDGLAHHPQLRVLHVDTPAGSIEVIAPPSRVKRAGANDARPMAAPRVPSAGEHTATIRREFAARPAQDTDSSLPSHPAGSEQRTAFTAVLFVPADRPERFEKAIATGADAVVIDLEDAVAAANRVQARKAVRNALDAGLRAFVRVNPAASIEGRRDLAALAGSSPRGIVIAKTASAEDIRLVRDALPNRPLIALIESIAGITQLEAIVAETGVEALAFGAYDLCAEVGARPTPEVLAAWRSRIVLAARAAGCRAIDTPYLDLADHEGLAADARRSVDFGFDGKFAVHPKQIAPIRAAFRPTASELARAHRIVDGVSEGGVGVSDGMMIDRPVLLAALRVIERAKNPN